MHFILHELQARTKNRILILSEDSEFAQSLSSGVARLGLELVLEPGYRVSKVKPKLLHYSGIIIDLDMRESPCLGLIHNLHSRNPDVPIVVVGVESRKYDICFALMRGATDFLIKPIDSVMLKRKCLRLFL